MLRVALETWTKPAPRFVLLVGDAARKPHPGPENRNLIPTGRFVFAGTVVPSDHYFVARTNNDIEPQLAIGRIPAVYPREVRAVVDKSLAYALRPPPGNWRSNVLWVSDSGPRRVKAEAELADELSKRGFSATLHESPTSRPKDQSHRNRLLRALNRGSAVVHFRGHGARHVWRTAPSDLHGRRDLLSSDDLEQLQPTGKLPLVLSMTCNTGAFDHEQEDSLAERFLFLPNRGAVAVIAATWRHRPPIAFSRALFVELANGARVGEALQKAKQAVNSKLFSIQYHLFGDPALKFVAPHRSISKNIHSDTPRGD
jgi:hypothetical protein